MKKTCIIISGPTASGKTSLAIELAKKYGTQIISADSRQCYRELNIGVAKPTQKQLNTVPHYFINSHSINDVVNAALFEEYALKAVEEIFHLNDVAIMVGGTGLYIKAFCEGLDAIPEINAEIDSWVKSNYLEKGMDWLKATLQKEDPAFYAFGEMQNPHRMLRALTVVLSTGQSIVHLQKGKKKNRPFAIKNYIINIPKEELHQRINMRVNDMMNQGLIAEVNALKQFRNLPALQTVGYKEIFQYFDGEQTLPEAIEAIKKNTRQYAKRQITWFKKYQNYNLFER